MHKSTSLDRIWNTWLRLAFASSVLILVFGFTLARAQKKASSSALQPDKGKFSLLVDGKSMLVRFTRCEHLLIARRHRLDRHKILRRMRV